jgi:hypothetical protein
MAMQNTTGRFMDVIVGVGMLIGAIILQAIFLTIFALAVFGVAQLANIKLGDLATTIILIAMFVAANVASFIGYRRRLCLYGYDPSDAKVDGTGGPKTTSATNVVYLAPRAIARIFIGSERLFTPKPPPLPGSAE